MVLYLLSLQTFKKVTLLYNTGNLLVGLCKMHNFCSGQVLACLPAISGHVLLANPQDQIRGLPFFHHPAAFFSQQSLAGLYLHCRFPSQLELWTPQALCVSIWILHFVNLSPEQWHWVLCQSHCILEAGSPVMACTGTQKRIKRTCSYLSLSSRTWKCFSLGVLFLAAVSLILAVMESMIDFQQYQLDTCKQLCTPCFQASVSRSINGLS